MRHVRSSYKVGHHGSRNASPRSLLRRWEGRDRPVTSLMSTKAGVHGHSEETVVPRATLIQALQGLGTLVSTQDFAPDALFRDIGARTIGADAFALRP